MAFKMLTKRILTLILCAVLTAVIVLSSFMTVFAWSDFTQSRTNDFRGTVAKTSVTLHKYEKTPEGAIIPRPVANASFFLYKRSGESWEQLSGVYITNISGKITVENLNSGSYKFVETDPGYGYTYDIDTDGDDIMEYPFTITADDAQGMALIAVEAYNRRERGDLIISKTVKIQEGLTLSDETLAEIAEQEFEFTVIFSDGGTYTCVIDGEFLNVKSGDKIRLKGGQTAVFEDLPVGLYYSVTETNDPDFILTSENSSGSITLDTAAKANFTNTYGTPEPKKINITVKKLVLGEIPESEIDREFNFYISINGGDPELFKLKAGESKTFELNSGDTYSITEEDPFAYGYIQTSAVNGAGTACEPDIDVIYTNTYIGPVLTVIEGEKTWDMAGGLSSEYPEYIIVELLANGEAVQTATVRADSDGKWLYRFYSPKYNAAGGEIRYTLREVPVPGFVSEVTGNNITNTLVKPVTSAPLKVQKRITGQRPEAEDVFTFKLSSAPGVPMPANSQITVAGEGEASFGDIIYATPGIFTYEISEVNGFAEVTYDETVYTAVVTVAESDGVLKVTSVNYSGGAFSEIAVFTNDYGGSDTVNISVQKEWVGLNSLQPDSVSIQLYRDGAAYGDPVVLSEENGWIYTWTELEKGPVWTVDETDVSDDYTKTVSGDAKNGFIVTNAFDAVLPGGDDVLISGKKTWEHGDNPYSMRPKSITVYVMDGDRTVASAEISEESDWRWAFKLPKFRADGSEIKYTLKEDKIDNYAAFISGYNITNIHNSTTQNTDNILLEGSKTWNFGSEPENERPQSITVLIKNGDNIVRRVRITAADGWRWAAYVPKYDESGNIINYTISEENVPRYSLVVNGYDLVNTYRGQDYPGDTPRTGDGVNLVLWIVLLIAGTLTLVTVILIKRRNPYVGKHKKNYK
ncbi:MAG TPA: hypothetical protein DEQ02_00690 [Ruminococcaceae bacterium]|nr:hypothetical protein [Oscillospiraceae bacterium]